jgi:hypothetical protein
MEKKILVNVIFIELCMKGDTFCHQMENNLCKHIMSQKCANGLLITSDIAMLISFCDE